MMSTVETKRMSVREKFKTLKESMNELISLEQQETLSDGELDNWIYHLKKELDMICPCEISNYNTFNCWLKEHCEFCDLLAQCTEKSHAELVECHDECDVCYRAMLWRRIQVCSGDEENGFLKFYTCLYFSELLERL